MLEGAVLLSQQKIEDRPVKTNFLIPSPHLDTKRALKGQFIGTVWVDDIRMSELSFKQLKRYIEIAGDESSYLIICPTQTNSFIFKGFLFFAKSLKTIFADELKNLLKSISISTFCSQAINESLIVSINDRTVTVSLGNEPFFRIEKGEFFEVSDFSNEISATLGASILFNKKADYIAENFGDERGAKFLQNIRLIIQRAFHEIITTIVDMRHGATLIFGSTWTTNDESKFQPGAIKVKMPFGTLILRIYESFYNELNYELFFGEDDFEDSLLLSENTKKSVDARMLQEELIEWRKAIINMSKTDGAMVFNQNLDVIGAGAFIKMNSTVIGSGGARKKSAESFVKANPGTVVIVISQDGMVDLIE